uniref:Uncharacterized protein n=1 Tax=viral metagenome TaxID=1070528 RepID=A0A6C0LZJ9_9ZZZZ
MTYTPIDDMRTDDSRMRVVCGTPFEIVSNS